MVRCFEDDNVIHVAGKVVDPIADIEVIQTELCPADMGTVEKSLHRYNKAAMFWQRQRKRQPWSRCWNQTGLGSPTRAIDRLQQRKTGHSQTAMCLITAKPAMFVGNVSETGFNPCWTD